MNRKQWPRKPIQNKAGATILSLILVAALAVGGLSTYATEEDLSADAVVTEETASGDTGAVTEAGTEEAASDPEITEGDAEATGDSAQSDSRDSADSAKTDPKDAAASAQTETAVDTSKISTAAADAPQDDADTDDTDDEDGDEETGEGLHADGLSDDTADVETAADWEKTLPDELTGVWADDLIEVAKSQLGYKESTKNYRVNPAGKHKGYTRYGAWYGDPYGDWCAMFVSFCLHYTDIPRDEFPETASCWAWTKTLDNLDMYEEADSGYEPVPGDLIFFDNNSKNEKPVDHVGIVTEIAEETDEETGEPVTVVKTIEGNSGNMVREREYDITDDRIVGYGVLPENPDLEDADYGLYGGYDGQDSMDDPDTAGSCVGWDEIDTFASVSGSNWWIDDYYIGESSQYTVSKTDNFSLKYQVEFHASADLAVSAVQIVIDASLGTYRDGNNIIPSDLGIPYGTPSSPTSSSSSPFNYYYINSSGSTLTTSQARTATGVQLVIWNYKEIVSGSNTMFQVLYNSLDVMQIPDGTSWSLGVKATVNGQTVTAHTLSGSVDTSATLTSMSKTAYKAVNVSYTPELYTQKQVSKYINGDIPEQYADHFDDYIYIVWYVTLKGSATQAYEITINESTFSDTTGSGSVVGYKVYTSGTTNGVSYTYGTDANGSPTLTFSSSTQRNFNAAFYVVTAYDADTYELDSEIENDVTITLHPVDGKDANSVKSASATTTWGEYEWVYRGNDIGVDKWHKIENGVRVSSGTYDAHLDLYKLNASRGIDTGEYEYSTQSTDRGYSFTHVMPNADGSMSSTVGEWKGGYYTTTTVDDVLYVYPENEKSDARMLTKEDYYFSSVSVTTNDYGYDVWEDETTAPNDYDGVDQSVYIYAMFADGNGSGTADGDWELVATVPFSASGVMSYTFTADDLARQPYRVKAVHSTADYVTYCTIKLTVMLRYDSPTLQECMDSYGEDLTFIRVEDLSGVAGQVYGVSGYTDGTYFQSQSTDDGNYSETGLEDFSRDLYGVLLQRDNAYVDLTELMETASAYKSVTTENDAEHGRVLANYYLTAYEAYYVTGDSTVEAFKDGGVYLPDRNNVTYCDLLPYGMEFNPSTTVVAGRITTMNTTGTWRTNSGAWNKSGVTVTVDDDDIITNWNDTGRTMVLFHIHYTGDDASAFYDVPDSEDDLWFEGFGLYFQAYYDWANLDEVDVEYNIAAYIADDVSNESEQLLGKEDSDVYRDDGSADNLTAQYAPFLGVSDLNGDGVTEWYTNMYCSTITATNVATSSSDEISKKVRADDDAVAEYEKTAIVGEGRGYTYEVSLKNIYGAALTDVVIFDHLEYAVEDGRATIETGSDSVFYGLSDADIYNHWTGTFLSVTTAPLEELGIAPVVWYNASRDAVVSSTDGTIPPSSVLTAANGWYTEANFVQTYGSLSAARSIAVDISLDGNGDPYVMEQDASISFQIHMLAPEGSDYSYAFNNTMYYSVSTDATGTATRATDAGDTVRVELGEADTLEVEKEFFDESGVPASMMNQKFTFEITRRGSALANQEYMVYDWDEETQEWVSSSLISATDINGQFTLKAKQKAVFDKLVDIEDVEVTESENVMWDSWLDEENSTADHYLFINNYRAPVYLHKTALTSSLATDRELNNATFTFYLEVDSDGDGEYEPYQGEYLYVKSVLTDGSSPTIDTSKGEAGHAYTADGYVTLHIGEIIVFFPVDEDGYHTNVPYRITETAVENADDWVCEQDTATGTTKATGTSETIENYFVYRNLIITKDLADYDHDLEDCTESWTFRLLVYDPDNADADADGYVPVSGNHWYMIDSSGDTISGSGTSGYLGSDGTFTVSGAGSGRRVVVERLVRGAKYKLVETDWNAELFETVNDGTTTATMPMYSITRSVTITNKYLLKDLSVSKLVLAKDTSADITTHEFTFTLERKNENGTYTAMGGETYYVDGEARTTNADGTFTLTNGETAVFDDIGYQGDEYRVTESADGTYAQIYPANGDAYDAVFGSDGDSVRFINGDFDEVASVTKSLNGLDEVGKAYASLVKGDNTADTLVLEDGEAPYTVDVIYGIYRDGALVTFSAGDFIDYREGDADYPYVYIRISADGDVTLQSYNGGLVTETVGPYDYIYIAGIGDCTLRAFENAGMERLLLDVTADTADAIGAETILSEGEVMSGEAAANENIVLINDISSAHRASEIYKLMSEDSNDVATGSRITFRVEIYSEADGTWSPAGGIRYITMDGYTGGYDTTGCVPTSSVLETGADGQITLVKGDEGYPYIRFVDDEVYANVYSDMEDGQLRIVEVRSGTDEEWGWLLGYDGAGWVGGPSLTIVYADTFVDANDDGLVFEVEKEMTDGSTPDQEFTFHLVHVLSAATSPIEHLSEINDSEAGAGVYYIVYDVSTGKAVDEGYTNEDGSFTLQAGQYAQFYVPEDTTWYVYEGMIPSYLLGSVTDNYPEAPNASVVDDVNGMVQNEHSVYLTHSIVLTLTDESSGSALKGGVFDFYQVGESGEDVLLQTGLATDANGQITISGLGAGQYYFTQTEAPGSYAIPADPDSETVVIGGDLKVSTTFEVGMENATAAVKYAVKIWGIQQDTYQKEDGSLGTAGLTFGPATGADHLNDYVSCGSDYCIHDMDWDDIIYWSATDPSVFESCLKNGCTKAVELTPNETLFNMETVSNYMGQGYEGDGVSTLYYLLNGAGSSLSRTYGVPWNYSYTGYSSSDPANVYSRSRIRATLTGDSTDIEAQLAAGGNNYYYTDAYPLLDESNCLLSCFPANLQAALVPRTTLNAGNPTYGVSVNDKTTYDKLFLFSMNELGSTVADYVVDSGGDDYGVNQEDSDRIAYEFSGTDATASSSLWWWSRSRSSTTYESAGSVSTDGAVNGGFTMVDGCQGLSPGFCLPGPDYYDVKYAVTIYGIQQDTYQADDGSTGTAGLTFGPATGASYVESYKAHLTEAQYNAGTNGVCLHWMTWEEIIEQSEKDPTVFQTCLEEGCTHSVNIALNDTLLGTSYAGQMNGGDGAGYLYNSISSEYRRWNGTADNTINSGGWPASKIRANMVGKDSYTNTTDASVAGDQYVLSADDCLFSCFPSVLQDSIVAKAVKSDTDCNDTSGNNVTTYDKLWLFSDNELYDGFTLRENEGELYQRSTLLGITTSKYAQLKSYDETGGNSDWWLRSPCSNYAYTVYVVHWDGDCSVSAYSAADYGLAPGFCLK